MGESLAKEEGGKSFEGEQKFVHCLMTACATYLQKTCLKLSLQATIIRKYQTV